MAFPKRFNTPQAAEYLTQEEGVTVKASTLEVWRTLKKGPQYRKVHNRVFYEREALQAFAQGEPVRTR